MPPKEAVSSALAPNVFYIVTRDFSFNRYLGPAPLTYGPWRPTLAEAQRFTTVLDAASAAVNAVSRKNTGVEIVRLTEVPGTSEWKVTSTQLIDGTKPVALFNVRKKQYYCGPGVLTGEPHWNGHVRIAHVYPNLGEALKFPFPRTTIGLPEEIIVHQVERVTTPATFKEEVVS